VQFVNSENMKKALFHHDKIKMKKCVACPQVNFLGTSKKKEKHVKKHVKNNNRQQTTFLNSVLGL
jgi:Zn ribbon nucleic-acid-binding protein